MPPLSSDIRATQQHVHDKVEAAAANIRSTVNANMPDTTDPNRRVTFTALKHITCGLGGIAAASLFLTGVYDAKTELQFLEGQRMRSQQQQQVQQQLAPVEAEMLAVRDKSIRTLDLFTELARLLGTYGLQRCFAAQGMDSRLKNTVSSLCVDTVLGFTLERMRIDMRTDKYTEMLANDPNARVIATTRDDNNNTTLAAAEGGGGGAQGTDRLDVLDLVQRVAPSIAYGSLVTLLAEFLLKKRMADFARENLPFLPDSSSDPETVAWSEFLSIALVRCVTLPLETMAKKHLSKARFTFLTPPVDSEEHHDFKKRQAKAGMQTLLLTIAQSAAPLVLLYTYRGISLSFKGLLGI